MSITFSPIIEGCQAFWKRQWREGWLEIRPGEKRAVHLIKAMTHLTLVAVAAILNALVLPLLFLIPCRLEGKCTELFQYRDRKLHEKALSELRMGKGDVMKHYLKADFEEGIGKALDPLFDADLEKSYKNIERKYQGFSFEPATLFDPHMWGNTPYRLKPINGCQMIRMPTVVRDLRCDNGGRSQEVVIAEEFLLFLKQQGKTHLYVNLMSRRNGNEKVRSLAIEQLNSKEICVISLDKDSRFYHQKDEVTDFKAAFLQELGNYFFGIAINLKEMMEEIHQSYFKGASLDRSARLDFIELMHLKIIQHAMKELQPASANISCKLCIDRGAAQNFVLQYQSHQEEDQRLLFGPAVMVSSRPLAKERFQRALSVIKRIKAHDS